MCWSPAGGAGIFPLANEAGRRGRAPTKGKVKTMYRTPSRLPEGSRAEIAGALNAVLADGLDLHASVKVAHWNLKGPHFAALHELFERIAIGLAERSDEIAERAVTLGGRALGTVRHVARTSRIADYPPDATRDLEHVKLLAERVETHLDGVRAARAVGERHGDVDTVDLLTEVATDLEKHGWFLRASLE